MASDAVGNRYTRFSRRQAFAAVVRCKEGTFLGCYPPTLAGMWHMNHGPVQDYGDVPNFRLCSLDRYTCICVYIYKYTHILAYM